MKTFRTLLFLISQLIVLQLSQLAHATLNVQILNTQITAGGSGFLDVMLTGDGDLVESASLQLQITPVNAVSSSLQFLNPQLVSFEADSNYLFSGNSFNQQFSIDPRVVSQTTLQNDTYATNDSTANLTNTSVTSVSKLLARVDLRHIVPQGTDPATVLNDLFQVNVVLGGTSFLDANAATVNFVAGGPGLVSITAVPEPNSAILLFIACVCSSQLRRKRSRCISGQ
jgi:hypothetical protein